VQKYNTDLASFADLLSLLIEFFLGAFDWFHLPIPIWIQVESIAGTVRLRCQMIQEFPYIRNVSRIVSQGLVGGKVADAISRSYSSRSLFVEYLMLRSAQFPCRASCPTCSTCLVSPAGTQAED
jgi:hypothetical protein